MTVTFSEISYAIEWVEKAIVRAEMAKEEVKKGICFIGERLTATESILNATAVQKVDKRIAELKLIQDLLVALRDLCFRDFKVELVAPEKESKQE